MDKYFKLSSKSFDEMGVKTYQELWNVVSKDFKGFSLDIPVTFEKTIKSVDNGGEDKEETIYTMVFSTPDKDRHGDIVVQNWILDGYKANPVLLDSHNYDTILNIVGRVNNIRIENETLRGELEFATMNPKGMLAKQMVEGGFINTSSVGFIPNEFDNEGRILKSELLENSLVSVPANARALFEKMVVETKAEIETLEKEISETTPVIKIVETKTEINKKKDLLKKVADAVKQLDDETRSEIHKAKVKLVTECLRDMEKGVDTWLENKRRIYKALRSL